MRLTKGDGNCAWAYKDGVPLEPYELAYVDDRTHIIGELVRKLAAYEDAEEQGRLVILPCKVGTRIYFNPPKSWEWLKNPPYEYEITNFIISCNKKNKWVKKYRAMQIINGKAIDSQINFEFYDIGKTVFLTRAEAEAALKGGKEDV